MNFDEAFEKLISHEGGYQNHRSDRGNWTSGIVGVGELKGTKYGISAMSYPDIDIAALTLEQAKAIYQRDYWGRFDKLHLPGELQFQLFDAAVNHGPGNAARMLQRAAGVVDDGLIGPITMAAVGRVEPRLLMMWFLGERLAFMAKLAAWNTFGRGWARRIADEMKASGRENGFRE